ncbi:MAG: class I SAM-dependent methyltransferase [Dongiaceae bacterium]
MNRRVGANTKDHRLFDRLRTDVRRLTFGVATLCGRPRGFFVPYRQNAATAVDGSIASYPTIAELLNRRTAAFIEFIRKLDDYATPFASIGQAPPPEPRWTQDWFPRLDGAAAYAMIRQRRPARIIEVGSGHSTRFMARAIEDGRLATKLIAIDPAPRASLAGLPIEWLSMPVPAIGRAPFQSLAAGDLLFIDSSHVLMPGTDVDFLLNDIVPRLPVGALLHFHDIFLPDDYPSQWRWRGYSEQLGVATLLNSGQWQVLFASHYAATRLADHVATSVAGWLPLPSGAFESSLWLERRAA